MAIGINNQGPSGGIQPLAAEGPQAAGEVNPNAKAGVDDVTGASNQGNKPLGNRPSLVQPKLTAAAMMIALTALNSKIAEQGIQFGEKAMESVRGDIKNNSAKRAEKLKNYLENMDKTNSNKKCGLFGAIIGFFKHLFKGEFKEAFKVLGDNIGNIIKDIAQIVAAVVGCIAAIAVSAVTFGGAAPAAALATTAAVLMVAGMALTDPGVMEMIMETLPEDQKQAVAIALAVVGAVLALTGGIMMGCLTGGASTLATISTVTTAVSGLISAGMSINTSVEGYKQSEFKAGAMNSRADMDVLDATMTDLKGLLDRNQKDLKTLFDSFSSILQSTRDMIFTQGQSKITAASV